MAAQQERVKNAATVADIVKCMRGCKLTSAQLAKFVASETEEDGISILEFFILDILGKTLRPTKLILFGALKKEFSTEMSSLELCSIVAKLLGLISFCRGTASRMLTSAKLSPKVRGVAKVFADSPDHREIAASSGDRSRSRSKGDIAKTPTPKKLTDKPDTPVQSKESIYKMYTESFSSTGISTPSPKRARASMDDLPSSQEVESILSSPGMLSPKHLHSEGGSPLAGREVAALVSQSQMKLNCKGCVNAAELCMQRVVGGQVENAKMTQGNYGFMIAQYHGELAFYTEIPNLIAAPMRATPIQKKPSAAPNKKPAAAEKHSESDASGAPGSPDSDLEESEDAVPEREDAVPERTYSKMWYKNYNSFGIRQKFDPKKQIFNLRATGASKEHLSDIADTLIDALEKGLAESECKSYADGLIDAGEDVE
jgi:hypothetical protein